MPVRDRPPRVFFWRSEMPEVTIEVEVWCSCGEGLCGQSSFIASDAGKRGRTGIAVEPCRKCLENADENGYERGYSDARARVEEGE
jgi:hypothetical protein